MDSDNTKLTHPVTYTPAGFENIGQIMEMVEDAREHLKKHKVDQWQGEYPAAEIFRKDIEQHNCYLVRYGKDTAGFFVLSAEPEPEMDAIRDGKWSDDGPYCILHRGAVVARYRGRGLSQLMLRLVGEQARKLGVKYIRVTTHRDNLPVLKLFRENGFIYRGNVFVDDITQQEPQMAFEKRIDSPAEEK